jgi:hypothetical protein
LEKQLNEPDEYIKDYNTENFDKSQNKGGIQVSEIKTGSSLEISNEKYQKDKENYKINHSKKRI